PAADRDHDRDHVVARRRADHDHRLRQHPGRGATDPLAHAASPRRGSNLGLFSVAQSFGLLLIGMEVLSDPLEQRWFDLFDPAQLLSVMCLQLFAGRPLLLFVPRPDKWFFLPPYPARPLVIAIVLTQVLAVLMCGLGWLVPPIPWTLIAWVWLYN